MTTKADQYIATALGKLGLAAAAAPAKYGAVDSIVAEINHRNSITKIPPQTTGTISERIAHWALEIAVPQSFYKLNDKNLKWLGDFVILGYPLNTIVSVKSFTAKERLLVSGTGSPLVPTIGFGLFTDPDEFHLDRLLSFLYRGFFRIYMPSTTYAALGADAKEVTNVNRRPLVRELSQFPLDLQAALQPLVIGKLQMPVLHIHKL